MNGWLIAGATVALVPTGMAIDHWAVQLRAFVRAVWRLFVFWIQAVTSGLPLVGPLLSASSGVHHGSPEEIKARRDRRAAAAVLAVDEAASDLVDQGEDAADQLEKTQPFKPYLIRDGKVAS